MRIPDKKLIAEMRRKATHCEYCRQPYRDYLHAHHWYPRGMGDASRLDVPINILFLDGFCHHRAEAGQITRFDTLALIAAREGLLQKDVRFAVETLICKVPMRTTVAMVRAWPFETLEHYYLVDSLGVPTLAGRMAGLQGVRK